MLSRGSGVPAATRTVFRSMLEQLEQLRADGQVVSVTNDRIGLEGESRLCIVFSGRAALDAVTRQFEALAEGVDLLQVKQSSCQQSR